MSALPTQVFCAVDGSVAYKDFPAATAMRDALAKAPGGLDFELVIASLEELISFQLSGPPIHRFTEARERFKTFFDLPNLFAMHDVVHDAIRSAFLRSEQLSVEQLSARDTLSAFIGHLGDRAQLVLATLNYDTLLDGALPWFDGFTQQAGAAYAEFSPIQWLNALAERDRHILIHLHGSMRFGFRSPSGLPSDIPYNEPVRFPTAALATQSIFGHSVSHPFADGQYSPASPIITGGRKTAKLLVNPRPFAYYNAGALEAIAGADRLLIIGYGFRDEHVNAWIAEHLRTHPDGRLAIVTHRSGMHVGHHNLALERFLLTLCPDSALLNRIYVQVEGGLEPVATRANIGKAYLVTTGVPMAPEVESDVLEYLFG